MRSFKNSIVGRKTLDRMTVAAVIIVLTNKEMFFETRHVGRLLETRYA